MGRLGGRKGREGTRLAPSLPWEEVAERRPKIFTENTGVPTHSLLLNEKAGVGSRGISQRHTEEETDWTDTSLLHHLHLPFPSSVYFLPDVLVYVYVCVCMLEHIPRRCSFGFGQSSRIWRAPVLRLRRAWYPPMMASLHPALILHPVFLIS